MLRYGIDRTNEFNVKKLIWWVCGLGLIFGIYFVINWNDYIGHQRNLLQLNMRRRIIEEILFIFVTFMVRWVSIWVGLSYDVDIMFGDQNDDDPVCRVNVRGTIEEYMDNEFDASQCGSLLQDKFYVYQVKWINNRQVIMLYDMDWFPTALLYVGIAWYDDEMDRYQDYIWMESYSHENAIPNDSLAVNKLIDFNGSNKCKVMFELYPGIDLNTQFKLIYKIIKSDVDPYLKEVSKYLDIKICAYNEMCDIEGQQIDIFNDWNLTIQFNGNEYVFTFNGFKYFIVKDNALTFMIHVEGHQSSLHLLFNWIQTFKFQLQPESIIPNDVQTISMNELDIHFQTFKKSIDLFH